MKILSIHDLQIIRKRAEHHLSLREESNEKVSEKCCGLASGTTHLQILICVVKPLPVRASLKIFKKPLKETG